MKSLYNEYEALNRRGQQASGEIYRFLDDFFKRWIAMGHDTRELQNIVVDETVGVSARERLIKAMEIRKNKDAKNRVQDYKEALKENEFIHLENKETGEITFVKGEKE